MGRNDISFEPLGRIYLTPAQKKDRSIKRLRCWVAVLAAADAIYTSLLILMICNGRFFG